MNTWDSKVDVLPQTYEVAIKLYQIEILSNVLNVYNYGHVQYAALYPRATQWVERVPMGQQSV